MKSKIDLALESMPESSREKLSKIPEKFLKYSKKTLEFDTNMKMITDGTTNNSLLFANDKTT